MDARSAERGGALRFGPMRYALIGDSQGQGSFGALAQRLEAAGHAVVLSRAVPGRDPGGWTRDTSLPGQLADARPDVVVYFIAGNNGDVNATSYGAKVAALIATARSAGARAVYWLSPATATDPATAARHEATATLEARIVPALGATWIDTRPLTRTGHRADGVHFTTEAYRSLAEEIAARVQPGGVLPSFPMPAPASGWWLAAAGVVLVGALLLLRSSSEE